jgi:PAS domain S-box-containing protein
MWEQARRSVSSVVMPTAGVDSRTQTAVLMALDEGLIVMDLEGRLLETNAAASHILGVDLDAAGGRGAWWEVFAARRPGSAGALDVGRHVIDSGHEVRGVEVEIDRLTGTALLSVNYQPLRGRAGTVAGLVLSFRDVSDREHERRTLLETQGRLREAHDVARLASWEWQPDTGDVIVFQALSESGIAPGTRVTLQQWLAMIPSEHHGQTNDDFEAFVSGQSDESVRRVLYSLPDGPVWLEIRSRALRDDTGRLLCVRGTAQDVSKQHLAQQELAATRDFLQATLDSLQAHIAVLDARGEIVMVNRAWDGFALDNGAGLGSAGVGANYLAACDAEGDGGSGVQAGAGLRAILAEEETEFLMEYACHSPQARRWFQLRATRHEGPGETRVVVTHENITERKAEERLMAVDLDKLAWVGRIEEALTQDRFVLHAQPILELASGRIVQRELLLRMRHSEASGASGLVAPASFLPVAEEFGLITKIDRWVIDRAAELAATGLPVELNVSGRSISDPRLVDYIKSAIERTGADPQMMVFEITETTLVDDDISARAFVARLHGLGCKVALDDFGTGYGGFTYLKQLPIDFLKIDIEFVSDLLHDPASRTVVQAIVKLAQGFGLKTVAEGVEDNATLEALLELRVDYAQGYFIGRPAPLQNSRRAAEGVPT